MLVLFRGTGAMQMTQNQLQPVVVTERPARLLVGVAKAFTMATRQQMPAQWQAFFAAGYEIPHVVPGAIYGVSFSRDAQGGFWYGIALEVSEVAEVLPEGTRVMHLDSGQYAVRRVFGPMAQLPEQMDWMFREWLPASGYDLREAAVFECYPDDPRNGPKAVAFELWFPVTPSV
jgi:AraC family transcriptional regulator